MTEDGWKFPQEVKIVTSYRDFFCFVDSLCFCFDFLGICYPSDALRLFLFLVGLFEGLFHLCCICFLVLVFSVPLCVPPVFFCVTCLFTLVPVLFCNISSLCLVTLLPVFDYFMCLTCVSFAITPCVFIVQFSVQSLSSRLLLSCFRPTFIPCSWLVFLCLCLLRFWYVPVTFAFSLNISASDLACLLSLHLGPAAPLTHLRDR